MRFPEKSAWVMAFAMLLTGGLYFLLVIISSQALGFAAPPNPALITIATILIVSIAIIGHLIAALSNISDANAREDERDKFIAQRSWNVAAWVLSIFVFSGVAHYTAVGNGNIFFHIIVLGMVLSHITDYALTIWLYRKGA